MGSNSSSMAAWPRFEPSKPNAAGSRAVNFPERHLMKREPPRIATMFVVPGESIIHCVPEGGPTPRPPFQ
jgi:hypothetical protein